MSKINMLNELVLFEGNDISVRCATDEHNISWFVLIDVLEYLGTWTKPFKAIASIKQGLFEDEDWEMGGTGSAPHPSEESDFLPGLVQKVSFADNLGRQQDTTVISLPALTYLVSRSNTVAGKKLNRFIHKEVLPALYKYGEYSLTARQQKLLGHLNAAREGLAAIQELTHDQRVSLAWELIDAGKPEMLEYLPESVQNDVRYFPEHEVARKGGYRNTLDFKRDLVYARLLYGEAITKEGKKYGRSFCFVPGREWRLHVLSKIKDVYEERQREWEKITS